MRRIDREITDPEKIAQFLAKEQIIRIAFYADGEIYIVPVNYGFYSENGEYCFYFHGAQAGRKYTLSLNAPAVGFEIDGDYVLHTAEKACGCSAGFMSVVGTGTVSVLDDAEERKAGLRCLMQHTTGNPEQTFDETILRRTAVFRLDVRTLSCKAKG